MKNIVLSAVAVLAMSSFAVAGGDIVPAMEPEVEVVVVEEVEVVAVDAGAYVGLGYGILSGEETYLYDFMGARVEVELESRDFDQLLLQAGYKFNSYVAVEGRYWLGMNDLSGENGWFNGYFVESEESLDAWGIYVKPMYPVTPEFDIYALLGYATSTLESDYTAGNVTVSESVDLDGFSWGLGAAYTFNESISVFADYVVLYDDNYDELRDYRDNGASSDFTISTINFGVAYNF